jgi:hypothetical protein
MVAGTLLLLRPSVVPAQANKSVGRHFSMVQLTMLPFILHILFSPPAGGEDYELIRLRTSA